jgi:hypothetical protein
LALTIVAALVGTISRAADFRVESKIFEGNANRPVSEILTLFHDGKVYDLLSSPREITIFDLAEQRIVLLDPVTQRRTELKTDQLTDFVEQMRVRATQQTDAKKVDPLLLFCAEPKFTETNENNGWLNFASPLMTYRVRGTRSPNPADAQAYREFADYMARLQTRVKQGARPPFPRLFVNGELEGRGLRPDEVELTLREPNQPKAKPVVLRSKHKYESKLYPDDLKRIDEAVSNATSFKFLPLDDYLRPTLQAQR